MLSFSLVATCFRGSIAPASLKADGLAGLVPRDAAQFPGLYCPGLIEGREGVAGSDCQSVRFRGSIAPASLKAPLRGKEGRGGALVSGALLPRPH